MTVFEVPLDEAEDYGKVCTQCREWCFWEEFYPRMDRPRHPFMSACALCNNRVGRERRETDPIRAKEIADKSRRKDTRDRPNGKRADKYNLTMDEFSFLHMFQEYRCAWCGVHESELSKKLVIDHDRGCCNREGSCGRCVRRLLCDDCNTTEGRLKRRPEALAAVEALAHISVAVVQSALEQFRVEQREKK
jgi:hypothetical protein